MKGSSCPFNSFWKLSFCQNLLKRAEKDKRAENSHSMHSLLDEGKITFGTGDVSDHEEKFSLLDDFHKFHAEAKTKTFPFPLSLSKGDRRHRHGSNSISKAARGVQLGGNHDGLRPRLPHLQLPPPHAKYRRVGQDSVSGRDGGIKLL